MSVGNTHTHTLRWDQYCQAYSSSVHQAYGVNLEITDPSMSSDPHNIKGILTGLEGINIFLQKPYGVWLEDLEIL